VRRSALNTMAGMFADLLARCPTTLMRVFSMADPVIARSPKPESGPFTPRTSHGRQTPPQPPRPQAPEPPTVTDEYPVGPISSIPHHPPAHPHTIPGAIASALPKASWLFSGTFSPGEAGRRDIDGLNVGGDWGVFLGADVNRSCRGNLTRPAVPPE